MRLFHDFSLTSISNLASDKTFYHHPDPIHTFGFVLLFFDPGGCANLIDSALVVANVPAVLVELFCEPQCPFIAFFYFSVQQRKHCAEFTPDLGASISLIA